MDKEQEIYYQAGLIFKKLGVRSVSMDDIAKELRVSKKTLYQYVKNKNELIDKSFDIHSQAQCEDFNKKAEFDDKNAIDILIYVSKKVIENNKSINPAFLFDVQKFYPEILKKYWDRQLEIVRERLITNINRGISEGIFREEINRNLIADMYLEKLTSVNRLFETLSSEYTFEEVITTMMENHIRAIANEKGLEYFENEKSKIN